MSDVKDKGSGVKVRPEAEEGRVITSPSHRLMLMELFTQSGLPLSEFAEVVGVPYTTLATWRRRFDKKGPEGLMDKPREYRESGSRLPEATKRAVISIRESHPEYGCERISDMLGRGPGLGASPGAVLRVIREAGLEVESPRPPRHPDQPRRFERARPNQLWQTDIFTFTLKRQNRRVYLVVFLDDNSRYATGYGLHSSMTGPLVIEVLKTAIGSYGLPEEVLSDQGPQYHSWRGKSRFNKELTRLGIKHIVARARNAQTLGKTERFWGTLWRECVSGAVFMDTEDARRRIGHFVDHYNFQRPHQGIEGMVPADRYFDAADEVKKTLAARVKDNALSLAKEGAPRKPFYLTGRVGEVDLSIHTEGERVVLNTADGRREEVDLRSAGRRPDGYEEVRDGYEAEEEEDEAAPGWESGGEEDGCGDPGGDERGTWPGSGGRSVGDLGDEVLRSGGTGDPGDGVGVRAPFEGEEEFVADGRDREAHEGERPIEEGSGQVPGSAEDGEEERKIDGTEQTGEGPPETGHAPESAHREAEGTGGSGVHDEDREAGAE